MTESAAPIRAAGGILLRGSGRATEIALVHRPAYDDWSLPKGKVDGDESLPETAVREVSEETGLVGHVLGPAGHQEYRANGTEKTVDYFLMRAIRFEGFTPNDEVDQVRWMGWSEAGDLLTYDLDRQLLADLPASRVTNGGAIHIVRHGAAGSRSAWEGPDEIRPLTAKGERQADLLAGHLSAVGVGRIVSSPYTRCRQTVEPLGVRLGIPVESHDALAEGPDRKAIAALLEEVAGTTTVLCSHGDVIPATLERLQRSGTRFLSPYECRKASTWTVTHDGADYADARYSTPPQV